MSTLRSCGCCNEADASQLAEVLRILEIGLNHEQQHQELLLTDILHAFSLNPIAPTYDAGRIPPAAKKSAPGFVAIPEGLHSIGFEGEGYYFDNEGPAHQTYLRPVRIARSLVTNAQWLDFIADGGYATPSLWLSDGWTTVQAEGWEAPGYWRKVDGVSHTLDARGPAAGRCRPRRSAMSATTRPTPSRAGWARICRPSRSGRSRPMPA